ncbi:MAG: ABC transporter ATP-binding protein [Chloroflexota bacterium]
MLSVKDIDVYYGHAKVLHDVSLEMNHGEMVFVIGRNGAGKTTLLKTISGVMHPAKGSIVYEGQEINNQSVEKLALRGIRYVAQDKKVFSGLTVRGNIELAAYGAGENISQSIDKVTSIYPKLREFMDLKAGGLSGGQREILLIGRALVGNPKLLLIDEPTEGLAAVVIDDIFRILNQMKAQVSAIIVEQNLATVSKLADRVYIMKEGKIDRVISDTAEIRDTQALECYL